MLLGADTGFFVAYANEHPRAQEIWQEFLDGQHTLVVSALSINEIMVYFFQRGCSREAQEWYDLLRAMDEIDIVPVSEEIAALSARYRHGLGLSTVDSVILATFLARQCDKMLATDSDFEIADCQKLIAVEILA